MEEAGDLIIPIRKGLFSESKIQGEIGQIAAGQISGRKSDEEITFFKSVGLAVQDMAVASLILKKAREQNLGIEVEL
jgi:ornithine cyclodeaminase